MTLLLLTIVAMLAIGLAGSIAERRAWNGGICKENGLLWTYFDTDSQGGRGYRAGEYVVWISWPGIAAPTKRENDLL